MKPFLKWAGGKSQLLPQIQTFLPQNIYTQEFCLIEPFIGGGAFTFWALENLSNLKQVIINDFNADLTNVYQVIKYSPYELIDALTCLQDEYDKLNTLEQKKPFYYTKRDLFNTRLVDNITQASLFIFLNKSGFNGLYRVNKKNQFNVPIGSYKKPKFLDKSQVLTLHQALQKVIILTGDFEQSLQHINANLACFFYFDPPYRPISDTSSFNSYAHQEFDDNEQIRLANFCKKIDKLGYQFLLSNSDPKNYTSDDRFFDDLYQEFNIHRVQAKRVISATADGRQTVNEILVSNY